MENENRGRIKYIIIISIILSLAFLSQQSYFRPADNNIATQASKQGSEYWSKLMGWFSSHVYPRVNGEVAKRGEEAKQEVVKQKDVAVQGIWEQIKNYLAAQFSKYSGTEVK